MDEAIKSASAWVTSVSLTAALPFEQYEKIIGIAESERFRNALVGILLMYRMDVLSQPNQLVIKKFDRVRQFLESEKEIQFAKEDEAEILRLRERPGGDRQYLDGLLSIARMN